MVWVFQRYFNIEDVLSHCYCFIFVKRKKLSLFRIFNQWTDIASIELIFISAWNTPFDSFSMNFPSYKLISQFRRYLQLSNDFIVHWTDEHVTINPCSVQCPVALNSYLVMHTINQLCGTGFSNDNSHKSLKVMLLNCEVNWKAYNYFSVCFCTEQSFSGWDNVDFTGSNEIALKI